MNSALDQFQLNIQRTRILCGIHDVLKTKTTGALDISDILRSALVMAVSALDQYIHEIVRLGILEIYRGERNVTVQSLKFNVSLESVRRCLINPSDATWLDDEVRERHSWQSFEQPDRIADAIRLISDVNLWETVASNFGTDTDYIKRRIKLIVDRRNKIVHEADIDPSFPNTRWPIDDKTVIETVTFIEQVVLSIHKAIAKPA